MTIKKGIFLGLIFSISSVTASYCNTLDLTAFNEKLEQANNIDGIVSGSPEALLLESLNDISSSLSGKTLTTKEIENALTVIDSTDLIEELFPKEANIKFEENFLAGSDLSISDLTNASFFLNSLNAKKLSKARDMAELSTSTEQVLSAVQNKVLNLTSENVSDLISELEAAPEIDLVQLTSSLSAMDGQLSSTIDEAAEVVSESTSQLQDTASTVASATQSLASATQSLSFAAGAAMASAAYSLDQAATAIANTISAGVAVDLDAASQGMGFEDFGAAVEAYNQQHGTNYTTQSAAQALGQ